MSSESLDDIQSEWHGSWRSYIIGFFSSLALTVVSFSLVILNFFTVRTTALVLVLLALVQATVQLLFFLHLGKEEKPKWETLVFGFMGLVLLIIALGSLWVMFNLNDRLMSGMETMAAHD